MKGRIISNELYTWLNQFSAAEKIPLRLKKSKCATLDVKTKTFCQDMITKPALIPVSQYWK